MVAAGEGTACSYQSGRGELGKSRPGDTRDDSPGQCVVLRCLACKEKNGAL